MYLEKQQGLGLVAAIFLITVVALLTAAIVRTVRTGSESFALDSLFHRAFLAAQSGAQLGSNRAVAPNGVASCNDRTWDLAAFGLPSCEATVTCERIIADGTELLTLRSTGRCDSSTMAAQRQVLVRLLP